MGEEFWWFYDVIAVAIIIIGIFLSGKKGFVYSAISLVGYAIALVIAFSVSSAFGEGIYSSVIRGSNIDKIEKALGEDDIFINKMDEYLESAGYNIKINKEKIVEIFKSGSNIDSQIYKYANNINGRVVDTEEGFNTTLHEAYATAISAIVSKQLGKFAAESAAEAMRVAVNPMDELAPLLLEESQKKAASYIADNYTAPAYGIIIRLMCFVLLMFIVIIFTYFLIKAFAGDLVSDSTSSHILGGFIGIAKGGVMVFVAAAIVRLWIILGSNEMLFFNFEAIDKTYIFKYFYNFILKM